MLKLKICYLIILSFCYANLNAQNQLEPIQTQPETPETNNQTIVIDNPTNNIPTQEPTRNTPGHTTTIELTTLGPLKAL